jgi:1-acyl-sn-glycerol-3-phosphate acyltransferase
VKHLQNTVLDWTATGAAVSGVFAVLFVFDVVQRVADRLGPDSQQQAAIKMACGINRAVRFTGAKFRVEGQEHVTPGKPHIIVSNHQSIFDISMAQEFLAPLTPRYISKHELRRGIPGVSYNLRRGGSACIDRKNPEQAHAEIERLSKRIAEEGFSVVIFPEGTRSKTGAMRPFREAGLRTMVLNAPGVPVLPVTTSGGSKLFRNQLRPITRDVELGFRIHPPMIPPHPSDHAAFSAFVKSCEDTIRRALPERDRDGRALHD